MFHLRYRYLVPFLNFGRIDVGVHHRYVISCSLSHRFLTSSSAYIQYVLYFCSRTKRKDKDTTSLSDSGGSKLYLEEAFTRETIHIHLTNIDLPSLEELVTLPYSFPQEEWFAWHSKFQFLSVD